MANLSGKRVHIAGSAVSKVDTNKLKLAHSIIYQIVDYVLSNGGGFVITFRDEPEIDGIPLIFDWTIIEAIETHLTQKKSLIWELEFSKPIMGVVYSNFEEKIPKNRRNLWTFLMNSRYFSLIKLPFEKSFGGNLRKQQSIIGDMLIILGGSKGVYDLAKLYSQSNKLIIPINIDLDNNGTSLIINEIQKDPLSFYPEEIAYNICSFLNSFQLKKKIDIQLLIEDISIILNSIEEIPFSKKREEIIYEIISELELIKIMIELMAELQRLNKTIHKQETKYTLWLSSLLNWGLKPYGYKTDIHNLSGKTDKLVNKFPELGGVGELDLRFLNKDGELVHICEALILDSLRANYISSHVKKIFKYDANGLPANFLLIYSTAKKFSLLWEKYINFINSLDLKYALTREGFQDVSDLYSKYSNIKVGLTSHNREGRICKLYHFFLDFF